MLPGELYHRGWTANGWRNTWFVPRILIAYFQAWAPDQRQNLFPFASEANIQGVDVILEYPFLKVFNLLVDAQHDRLVVCPDEIQEAPIPSQEMKASVTMRNITSDCKL